MKKKKVLLILILVLLLLIAGGFLAVFLHSRKQAAAQPAPAAVPNSISAFLPSDPAWKTELTEVNTDDLGPLEQQDEIVLFGQKYPSRVRTAADPQAPVNKLVEYLDTDGETALYTGVFADALFFVYNRSGQLIYIMTADQPDSGSKAVQVEPISWFYANGKPVLGELCFLDTESGSSGAAYYDETGALLGYRTDGIPSFSVQDQPEIAYRFFDAQNTEITEQTLIDLLTADSRKDIEQSFLYLSWSKPNVEGD